MSKKQAVSKKPAPKKLTPRAAVKPVPSKPAAPAKTFPTPSGGRRFSQAVDVPDPTPAQAKARALAVVVQDKQSRTALELRRLGHDVIFIPNEADSVYRVERLSALAFDQRYQPVHDYPVGRAARLLVGYATNSGGTSDVMAELANLVHVTEQETAMATAKAANTTPSKTAGAKPSSGKPKPSSGPKKERGPSASGRFKELIMAGKQTDDEIFKTVQKEFNLSDDKRNYVAWYRNYLRKQGQNPPAPKGGEAVKVAPAAKGKKTKTA